MTYLLIKYSTVQNKIVFIFQIRYYLTNLYSIVQSENLHINPKFYFDNVGYANVFIIQFRLCVCLN